MRNWFLLTVKMAAKYSWYMAFYSPKTTKTAMLSSRVKLNNFVFLSSIWDQLTLKTSQNTFLGVLISFLTLLEKPKKNEFWNFVKKNQKKIKKSKNCLRTLCTNRLRFVIQNIKKTKSSPIFLAFKYSFLTPGRKKYRQLWITHSLNINMTQF